MNPQTNMPPSQFSANSQSIRKFQSGRKLKPLLLIVLPLLLAGGGYAAYSRATDPVSENGEVGLINGELSEIGEAGQVGTSSSGQNSSESNPSSNKKQSGASSSTTKKQDSVTGSSPPIQAVIPDNSNLTEAEVIQEQQSSKLPAGAEALISSIEKNGIKGHPDVTADTSSVPNGTSIRAYRESWLAYGDNAGNINGTISVDGKTYAGSLLLQVVNGKWKATSYTVEQ